MIPNRRLLPFLLLLLSIAPGCRLIRGGAAAETRELLAEGGEKQLRDPMHPIRGGTRVLVFALDGVGDDDFRRAVRQGRMPRVAALFGPGEASTGRFAHAYMAPDVLTVLPSITQAAWVSLFTGRTPAETGVPGNEWFDRTETRFYAPSPSTVGEHEQALRVYTDDLLGKLIRVPTLYEQIGLRAHVASSSVHRGADLLTVPEINPFGDLFTAAVRQVAGVDSARQKVYEEMDEVSVEIAVEALEEHGVPDVQTVYFAGVDLFTHITKAPLEGQQAYLEHVVDPAIGRVLDAYRKLGALDRTYLLFVSDHGQTPVLNDGRHALSMEGEEEPPEVLRRAGFRVRSFELEPDAEERDFQAVFAYQGGIAFVYLADRSTCPEPGQACAWSRPPRLEEDVLAAARAFHRATEAGDPIPALRGTLDLILARPGVPAGRRSRPFQVFDGERLVPLDRYLSRHPRPDLRELESRLEALASGPSGHLAGDLLLISRMRLEDPLEERFYFGHGYHSWHGSPNVQDSRVPFVLAHPARSGAALEELVRRALAPEPSVTAAAPLVRALLEER